jgi:hypothetical protein
LFTDREILAKAGRQKAESGSRKAEGRKRKPEGRRQKAESGRRKAVVRVIQVKGWLGVLVVHFFITAPAIR